MYTVGVYFFFFFYLFLVCQLTFKSNKLKMLLKLKTVSNLSF